MDAAWKVYVGDRRFDDNQISNLFLKLKYETVGRFTFDFRPIDGDESYMQNGRTLRIFWGDLHRLDGVIQRADWDSNLQCYHVYGADIRGFLLDRVNTEPSTVSSYTSDVQTQVMYTGCDFPSNIWTGAGDKIGTYTFHYKLGIQNTIRITGATRNQWYFYTERGTVYNHVGGCLYDATKNWAADAFSGATLRFVSGACKNNVYNINGNTANRVCIRLPGEPATMYATGNECARYQTIGATTYYNIFQNSTFESGTLDPWALTVANGGSAGLAQPGYDSDNCLYLNTGSVPDALDHYTFATQISPASVFSGDMVTIRYRMRRNGIYPDNGNVYLRSDKGLAGAGWLSNLPFGTGDNANTNVSWPGWDVATATLNITVASGAVWKIGANQYSKGQRELWIDDIKLFTATGGACVSGTIPGCSRIGDIYEIVVASTVLFDPATFAPATLVKDTHIIQYNQVDDLSDHSTVVTVMGAGGR